MQNHALKLDMIISHYQNLPPKCVCVCVSVCVCICYGNPNHYTDLIEIWHRDTPQCGKGSGPIPLGLSGL